LLLLLVIIVPSLILSCEVFASECAQVVSHARNYVASLVKQ
jgi:hypothetical protein